jgi:hypothetical protein
MHSFVVAAKALVRAQHKSGGKLLIKVRFVGLTPPTEEQ